MSSSEKDSAGSPADEANADKDDKTKDNKEKDKKEEGVSQAEQEGKKGKKKATTTTTTTTSKEDGETGETTAVGEEGGNGNGGGNNDDDNGEESEEGEIVEDTVTTPVPGGKKTLRGRVWRRNGECLRYRCEEGDGVEYNPGDAVYVESESPDMPYHICIIQVRES